MALKGHIPWNKGTKGLCKPNSGTFKKGNVKNPLSGMKKGHKKEPMPDWWKEKNAAGHWGKKASIETRRKMSEAHKGEKCHFFIDGKSKEKFGERKAIMHSMEYKLWREAVFERDDYTCIFCGKCSQKGVKAFLHADHIKSWAQYPELRFAIDNGRTLCAECHYQTDTFGGHSRRTTK